MADKNITTRIFRGNVNRDLQVNYAYSYKDPSNPENKYPTIRRSQSGTYIFEHNYGLSISEGFQKSQLFIGNRLWNQFVTLLDKSVTLISENLLEIFPDVNNTEFEIDQRALERFQTEKACSTAGITIVPTVWVDQTNQCYPALEIKSLNGGCVIPLEDAIPLRTILNRIDPIAYGYNAILMMCSLLK
jgi:hypothetical protein